MAWSEEIDQTWERTEPPTPRRLEQARQEGVVFRSRELTHFCILVAGFVFLVFYLPYLAKQMGGVLMSALQSFPTTTLDRDSICAFAGQLLRKWLLLLLPFLGAVMAVTVGASFVQSGVVFSFKAFERGWEAMSPGRNWARLFRQEEAVRMVLQFLKLVSFAVLLGFALRNVALQAPAMAGLGPGEWTVVFGKSFLWFSGQVFAVFLIFAAIDYAYSKIRYEQSLRMTRQEVREEMRELEGDRQVRRAAQETWKRIIQKQSLALLNRSVLIVTDGKTRSVGIGPSRRGEVVLLVKAAGSLVEEVREEAQRKHLAVIENPALARELFREVKLNHAIPLRWKAEVWEMVQTVRRLKEKET